MSVLIKGMKMPKHCWQCGLKDSDDECMAMYAIDRQIANVDEVWGEQRVPDWCPLIEIPHHGDLIDKEALYNKTAEWEAQALAQLDKLNRIPFYEMEKEEYIAWRVWSAIYQERSAFKHDVFDAPVVIEAEGETQ